MLQRRERVFDPILHLMPEDQLERVFAQDDCEIDEMILKRMKRIDLPQVQVEIKGRD